MSRYFIIPALIFLVVILAGCGGGTVSVTGISFITAPAGAHITLDTVDTGHVTPRVFTGLTPGSHIVLLELSGYDDYYDSVMVYDGQITTVNVVLTESIVPPPPF